MYVSVCTFDSHGLLHHMQLLDRFLYQIGGAQSKVLKYSNTRVSTSRHSLEMKNKNHLKLKNVTIPPSKPINAFKDTFL